MLRPSAFLLALLALGALAQGSTVESVVYGVCLDHLHEHVADELCRYQADGGGHGDASDSCESPHPALHLGASTNGTIFPPVPPAESLPSEDPSDNYALDVGAGHVNVPLYVALRPGTRWSPLDEAPVAYRLRVHAPIGVTHCALVLADSGHASAPWTGASLTFTPPAPGTYTLEATVSEVRLAKLEHSIPVSCHFMCAREVNQLVGYRILVNDTPV